jgi:hypothetical protein
VYRLDKPKNFSYTQEMIVYKKILTLLLLSLAFGCQQDVPPSDLPAPIDTDIIEGSTIITLESEDPPTEAMSEEEYQGIFMPDEEIWDVVEIEEEPDVEQIFASEDALLLALQGSWLWQGIEKPVAYTQDSLFDERDYFKRYHDGFTVSYLLGPVSVLQVYPYYIPHNELMMDLDMSKVRIDLAKNSIVVESYYTRAQVRFVFLDEQTVEVTDYTMLPQVLRPFLVYTGPTIWTVADENTGEYRLYKSGDAVGQINILEAGDALAVIPDTFVEWLDYEYLRLETPEEMRERFTGYGRDTTVWQNRYRLFYWRQNAQMPYIVRSVFVKVDGFDSDADGNVYDKDGSFLMNAQMIKASTEHNMPPLIHLPSNP